MNQEEENMREKEVENMKERKVKAANTSGEAPDTKNQGISRRNFIKTTGAVALTATAGTTILPRFARAAAPRTIKVGYPTPKTGPLAAFAEPDDIAIAAAKKVIGDGIVVNGVRHPVEIIIQDTKSDSNRAAQVADQLIKSYKVDLLIAANTPDMVNPIADQAEINGVPCLSTDSPYEAYFFGRGGKPDKGFDWTYDFFWGEDDLIEVYTDMWLSIPTNKKVGVLWSDTTDGNAEAVGFTPVMKAKGFTIVNPGFFQSFTTDFSAQINLFKKEGCEIVQGVLLSPEFATFWNQVAQQGYKPKIVTPAKALLFPAGVNMLGDRGTNLTTEIWWHPLYPFKSSLTGQTCAQLCAEWESTTGKQWTPPLGFKHAMMEVVVDLFKRTQNLDSPASVRDAMASTKLDTIVGHIEWTGKPVKNVCRTPLTGGQWGQGKKFKYDLSIVNNQLYKNIPTSAKIKPLV